MCFLILLCSLVSVLIPISTTQVSTEVRYECGPHGRFEYCIDGIPGCVVGCHCHPGYYFDTDTKICEPNIKLTQDFRRNYIAEPTRVYADNFPTVTEVIPTPTSNVDDKPDEFSKDTDNLGDWLYNQFFKTIENQVISNSNNTKPKTPENPTRRQGASNKLLNNKPKRKSRKSIRGRKKKKRLKAHGLRRKLLRITEDDSLFDSDSDSDTSDSSDYSDYSESDGSDYSDDTDYSDDDERDVSSQKNSEKKSGSDHGDDKEHGHKKVIIFNKRPKPPLPSFIFLPNMDTPFYPPIGLPPPPPMPMYPMVPVPPMAPFPFPGPPRCDHEENHGSTTTTPAAVTTESESTEPTVHTEHAVTTEPSEGESTDTTTSAATEDGTEAPDGADAAAKRRGDRRTRLEKYRNRKPISNQFRAHALKTGTLGKVTHGPKEKLMQKLRQRLNERRKNKISPADFEKLIEGDEESPTLDDVPDIPESLNKLARKLPEEQHNNMPNLGEVDFKYLSELIHRVNQNDAKNKLPELPFNLTTNLKEQQQVKPQISRRNYDPYYDDTSFVSGNAAHNDFNQHRTLHKPELDDTYYTNLGRQIASMIRSSDSKANQQLGRDSIHGPVQFHSVLNRNIDPIWERSVRSPLSQVGVPNYLDESRTLRRSNDKNLVNLEREVEIFASTLTPMRLQDIENILNTMQKAQEHIIDTDDKLPINSSKHSNDSLNVNLLPNSLDKNKYFSGHNQPNEIIQHDLSLSSELIEHYDPLIPDNVDIDNAQLPVNIKNYSLATPDFRKKYNPLPQPNMKNSNTITQDFMNNYNPLPPDITKNNKPQSPYIKKYYNPQPPGFMKNYNPIPPDIIKNYYPLSSDLRKNYNPAPSEIINNFNPLPLDVVKNYHQQPFGILKKDNSDPQEIMKHYNSLPPGPMKIYNPMSPNIQKNYNSQLPGITRNYNPLPPDIIKNYNSLQSGSIKNYNSVPPEMLKFYNSVPPEAMNNYDPLPPETSKNDNPLPPGITKTYNPVPPDIMKNYNTLQLGMMKNFKPQPTDVAKDYTPVPPDAIIDYSPLPVKMLTGRRSANITNTSIVHEQENNEKLPPNDYWMYQNKQQQQGYIPQRPILVTSFNNTAMLGNPITGQSIYETNPPRAPIIAVVRSDNNQAKNPHVEYLQFLRSMPIMKQTTEKKPEPNLVNYKTLDYFSGNKHHYMFEAATYPLQISPFKRQMSKPFRRALSPSYFHHALHHYDYFD